MTSRLCSITITVLPRLHQAVEDAQQLLDVVEVEAGGGPSTAHRGFLPRRLGRGPSAAAGALLWGGLGGRGTRSLRAAGWGVLIPA